MPMEAVKLPQFALIKQYIQDHIDSGAWPSKPPLDLYRGSSQKSPVRQGQHHQGWQQLQEHLSSSDLFVSPSDLQQLNMLHSIHPWNETLWEIYRPTKRGSSLRWETYGNA